jgi:hypothetical protein
MSQSRMPDFDVYRNLEKGNLLHVAVQDAKL